MNFYILIMMIWY